MRSVRTPAFGSGRATVRHGLRPTDRPRRAGGSSLREPRQPRPVPCGPPDSLEDGRSGVALVATGIPTEPFFVVAEKHHRCHVGHHDLGPPPPSSLEMRPLVATGSAVGPDGDSATVDHGRFKTGSDSLVTSLRTALTWNAWSHTAARREADMLVASTPCAMDRTVLCKRCRASPCPGDPTVVTGARARRTSVMAPSRSLIPASRLCVSPGPHTLAALASTRLSERISPNS